MKRSSAAVGVAVLLVSCSGCYRYLPAAPESLAPGAAVRVHVNRDRARELEEYLDQDDARVLSGLLLEPPSPETLRLSVPFQGVRPGTSSRGFNSLVDLSFLDLEGVEVRELNWRRTSGLIGLSAVLAAIAVDAYFDPFSNGEGEAEPGDVNAVIIPLLRLRW